MFGDKPISLHHRKMAHRAKYIAFEGLDGLGKTIQVALLVETLQKQGTKAKAVKEPGVALPAEAKLREVMLSDEFAAQVTDNARELISQANRSIVLEKEVIPALSENEFVISDRSAISGYAYAIALGHPPEDVEFLARKVIPPQLQKAVKRHPTLHVIDIYDEVIYFTGDIATGLARAGRKQEFKSGDVMEGKELSFHEKVALQFQKLHKIFGYREINIDGKTIEEVHAEILQVLGLLPSLSSPPLTESEVDILVEKTEKSG